MLMYNKAKARFFSMEKYLKEVERNLKKVQRKRKGEEMACYLNTNYQCLGLSVPKQRDALDGGYSFLKQPAQVDKIWNYIWQKAVTFEVFNQCLLYYSKQKKDLTLQHWKFLKTWAVRIDNWENSDRLCDIYAELMERFPAQIYPQLKKWNASQQPWARRISLVSLFYYSSMRKRQPGFSKALALVHNLMYDKDIYVQKGVGWTLRELYNVYPAKTYQYLLKHAVDLAPAAWQASTEKLNKKDKARLKKLRDTK